MLEKCNKKDVAELAELYMSMCGYFAYTDEKTKTTYFVNIDAYDEGKHDSFAFFAPADDKGNVINGIANSFIEYIDAAPFSEEQMMTMVMERQLSNEQAITNIVKQTKSLIVH